MKNGTQRQIMRDYEALRRHLKMPNDGGGLTALKMVGLHQSFCRTYPHISGKPLAAFPHEAIGHEAIRRRIMKKLEAAIRLTAQEKRDVSDAIGVTYSDYRPERVQALERLENQPERWREIRGTIEKEANGINRHVQEYNRHMETLRKKGTLREDYPWDMFSNPLNNLLYLTQGLIDAELIKQLEGEQK